LAAALLAAAPTAQGETFIYNFTMDAPSEFPTITTSPDALGTGKAVYDDVAGTLELTAQFSGLTGNVTQTHFHGLTSISGLAPNANPTPAERQAAATAAQNASIMVGNTSLPGFPLGVTSGTYAQTLNLNDGLIYNQNFLNTTHGGNVANARAAFVGGLASGQVYWNIHSSMFGGGELRGFPVLVPEPASAGLAGLGMLAVARLRRRRS
jgi:hypothetical protein